MADVLNQNSTFGGAFQAQLSTLSFSAGPNGRGNLGTGLVIQDLQGQYTVSVNRVWELGPDNRCYYIVGHPQGGLSIGRIVGPAPVNNAFMTKFTDACQVSSNVITISGRPGMCDNKSAVNTVNFENCLVTSLGIRINSNDMVLGEQIQILFSSMTDGATRRS